jgi:hypothetical protein
MKQLANEKEEIFSVPVSKMRKGGGKRSIVTKV